MSYKNKNNFSYQKYLEAEKIKLAQVLSIVGAVLYGAFIIVDYFALPSAFIQSTIIRLSVMSLLALVYAITFSPVFIKYYSYIVGVAFLVAFLGVESMIYLATPQDQAYYVYFAGVIIIMIALYSWTYLPSLLTAVLTVCSLLGYFAIEFFVRGTTISNNFPILITNTFMLGSTVVFGLLAQVMRDRHLKENFFLQQSLEKALESKTEEAEDYAYEARHDILTGLPNRRYVTELLEKSLEIAKEKDRLLILLFVDLNGFKQVNDIYGHAAGDEVLCVVARRLELAIRGSDSLSRLGGDEYLIGLRIDKEQLSDVENMVKKFEKIISSPMHIDGVNLKVGASIGIAAYPIHGNKISALIDIADKKMYQVKKGDTKHKKLSDRKGGLEEPVVIFPGCRFTEIS